MQCDDRAGGVGISIHALHEESDNQMAQLNTIGSDFNPRSP